ncbi:Planctomycete cytochrome C [Stieleria bergensis]|uniref:Planctomycete cytochrome C n=1 Tax=Stieleria bergensis TaxID=2528025 RepID=A0A517ST37_9BACT|nr:Planctomycete cytochrome C [Planctomycetes bacterium SV_7m_r]
MNRQISNAIADQSWLAFSLRHAKRSLQTVLLALLLPATSQGATADEHKLAPSVTKYFQQFCYQCHGETSQKGDRRLDQLPAVISADDDAALLLEEALDAINRGDMPPSKSKIARPTESQTKHFVSSLTDYLSQLAEAGATQSTVMRRLNRFEYANTMRDILQLTPEFFDRTSDFPVDAIKEGFDNQGESLSLSEQQLERYLEVAEAAVDAATSFDVQQPSPKEWHFHGSDFNGVHSYQRAPVTWRLIVDNDYLEIGHGQPSERHPNFVPSLARAGGAPAEGWYTIKVRAAAANRLNHGYDHREFDRFKTQRLKLALWVAPEAKLLVKNAADQRRLSAIWELPDGQPQEFTQRVWLNKGAVPFISWTNGVSSKGNIRLVAEKHHPEVVRSTTTERDAALLGDPEAQALVARLAKNDNNPLLSEVYRGPRVRVYNLDLNGPEIDQWPPASHQLLYGTQTDASKLALQSVVQKFARRAFRRPVTVESVDHYVQFIQQRIAKGDSHAAALKLGLAAILTSPRFLYLDEGNEETGTTLASYELASRLSYFLWSSMPDDELFHAAESGQLATKAGLQRQVERMLGDAKSNAFVEHFTDTWLRINTLGSMPPDPKAFASYYRDRLEDLFKQETRMFFADLLKNNRSIVNLLDSDYAFVNDVLAQHYGIENIHGEQLRRVALKPEHRRGGLMGQGSVLTLSANGIETSPVVRGMWVLENILGTPPPPPPPDVPAIEPDTRGTTTIREQLDKHRTVAACADCHRKIDPAGFALEFYDPIGGFRQQYPGRPGKRIAVDGSGQLPSGESFEDETGLKKILVSRKNRFAETLTEKLLTYATGRSMTSLDYQEIKQIATACAQNGDGLRDLVLGVANSQTFRSR